MTRQDALCLALVAVFAALGILRLTGLLRLPWWLVTAPLWCLPALWLTCVVLAMVCAFIAVWGQHVTQRAARRFPWLRSRS